MINSPMTVGDLIAKLCEIDPDARVVFYTEDEGFLADGHSHRLLDAIEISQKEFEPVRGDDGIPALKLEKTPNSIPMAVIELTSDF